MSPKKEEDLIDLTKLSQRELLILLNRDVTDIKKELEVVKSNDAKIMLKVNTLETKSGIWGGISGFVGAIAAVFGKEVLMK